MYKDKNCTNILIIYSTTKKKIIEDLKEDKKCPPNINLIQDLLSRNWQEHRLR